MKLYWWLIIAVVILVLILLATGAFSRGKTIIKSGQTAMKNSWIRDCKQKRAADPMGALKTYMFSCEEEYEQKFEKGLLPKLYQQT